MSEKVCPQCGAPLDPNATECKYCGEKLAVQQAAQTVAQPSQPASTVQQINIQAGPQAVFYTGINPMWPIKNKLVAALLAIFLGGIGIHEFYLGRTGKGIVCLLFCWTGIPAIVAFIQGIIILCSKDENFQLKYHVRVEN